MDLSACSAAVGAARASAGCRLPHGAAAFLPDGAMRAVGRAAGEVGDRTPRGFEQDEQVVDQIGGFVDHRLAVAGDGLDDRLDGLLADLLGDLVHAVREEPRRVGAFGHRGVALADDGLQAADEPLGFGNGLAEAALRSRVAGGAVGNGADQQCVAVAVGRHRDDVEPVAAGFAFRPEALPRAAVKGDAPLGEALFVGFAVHVAEHQHLQGAVVLHDGGDQSVGLLADGEFLKGNGFDFHGVSRLCFSAWSSVVLFRCRRSAAWAAHRAPKRDVLRMGGFFFRVVIILREYCVHGVRV